VLDRADLFPGFADFRKKRALVTGGAAAKK